MFSRAVPRAASRLSRFAQCDARPQLQTFARCGTSPPWRPVQQPWTRRYRSTFREKFREEVRKAPIMFPFAVGVIVVVSGILVFYVPWYYINVIVKPYHNYPEPVAKKLRRALFYSRGKHVDLREAGKYFRQALQVSEELGMDPFSDEIMGIKYMVSCIFEENEQYGLAIDVLELLRVDTQRWMDEYSHRFIENGNRSRVFKNMIQVNVKLAQLYDVKYVNEPELAEKRLVQAVEWALGEKQRREKEGLRPGEGEFMTNEELGGTLEALGNHYEQFDQHYLATPLYLQALTLCPPKSCHAVVLMNNISICLAQQTPPPPASGVVSMSPSPSSFPVTQPPPRAILLDQARQWANKALALAAEIQSPEKTEECDMGCAVATHNLGEFFEMEGKIQEGREKYNEALKLSKSLRFSEGQTNARAGLMRLKELENKQQ